MNNPFEQIDLRLSNIEELLISILSKRDVNVVSSTTASSDILTIQQASTVVSLSIPTIYRLVGQNQIPFMKRDHSKRLYFSRQELESWIREGRRKTVSECANEVAMDLKKRAR